MPYLTNSSYINCKSYNSVLSSDNIKENNNIRLSRRYSIDDDNKKGNNSSLNNLENSIQFNNIQNKVDHYLNSLYRHNFAEEIISGTPSIHLINKDKSLYRELFPKNNKKLLKFLISFLEFSLCFFNIFLILSLSKFFCFYKNHEISLFL